MSPRSYRSPVRSAAAQETRARLVGAASELLAGPDGARGFSLEAVAKASGVTRLTVYNQFGSRRALLEAVFDQRAQFFGMHRVAEAMQNPDPLAGIASVIAFFCEFWGSNREAMAHLHATSVGDPEFEESLRQRNERRRQILGVLVGRLTPGRRIGTRARGDVVDMLFVLTSHHVFFELASGQRTAAAARRLIEGTAMSALAGAGFDTGAGPRPSQSSGRLPRP
jgi:AcrR family transcriptional regulator